jgi:alcohol dehydrogenase
MTMRTTWSFHSAGQLVFGPRSVEQLGDLTARRGWSRILLVSDPVLEDLGMVARIRRPLEERGLEVACFLEGEPEPSLRVADRATSVAREFQPDAILALGGGSNMDLAKIVATLVAHPGSPSDYFGFDRIPSPVVPLICVPTTAGTGSEVSHAAVLTDTQQQMKVSTLSQYLRPALAVVDPELTYGAPRQVTADSGIDALTHAIEAYTATDFDQLELAPGETCAYEGSYPLADGLAEQAIESIGRSLEKAVQDPQDHEARNRMALAATLAGLAFSNAGVALVHALEYPIGGAVHCSHGAGNGLLLPYVMRFNLPRREQKMARIAALLGVDVSRLSPREAAERGIEAIEGLRERIGIPTRIRQLGATREQLPQFAEKSFAIQRLRLINPRPASQDDLLGILEAAF